MTSQQTSAATLEATYTAIVQLTAAGLPTTIREIQAATNASATSVVARRVRHLVAAGRVLQAAGISRSIRLPPGSSTAALQAKVAALESELAQVRAR